MPFLFHLFADGLLTKAQMQKNRTQLETCGDWKRKNIEVAEAHDSTIEPLAQMGVIPVVPNRLPGRGTDRLQSLGDVFANAFGLEVRHRGAAHERLVGSQRSEKRTAFNWWDTKWPLPLFEKSSLSY